MIGTAADVHDVTQAGADDRGEGGWVDSGWGVRAGVLELQTVPVRNTAVA